MTEAERKHVHNISLRLQDVISYLQDNDPKYFTDEDFDSLTVVLSNIAKVLRDMSSATED
ncbi:MAG: hypothetical protein H0S85_07680 [Desulfovibrionaceae bacterium]|jgi:hypothetical protein|nr:hypothetical protein [Desulfovibrionaceae bacterium]